MTRSDEREFDGTRDFEEHNAEVKLVWDSFHRGNPIRVPMVLGLSSRYFMFHGAVNPDGITYREYSENPDVMFAMQVHFDGYRRTTIRADYEMGIPNDGWDVVVDFQNYFEAAWLGAEIVYIDGNVPDARPFLDDDRKNKLFDNGIPDPFSRIMGKGREYYERFLEKARNFRYRGVRVARVRAPFLHTDGPFTVACSIRGTTQICADLYEEPDYIHRLLSFITEATITRIMGWRQYLRHPDAGAPFFFADDSIVLLSVAQYREYVLPYHKRLCSALSRGCQGNSIHLCGDAARLFPIIRDELDVRTFDTGFPVNHGYVVRSLGPEVTVLGGPHIEILRNGTMEKVTETTERILADVMPSTRRFILREGNNVAPGTPVANIAAMYQACREHGRFTGASRAPTRTP